MSTADDYETPRLDQLIESDDQNFKEARRVLEELYPNAMALIQSGIDILHSAAKVVGESDIFGTLNATMKKWREETGLTKIEDLRLLQDFDPSGLIGNDTMTLEARRAFFATYSLRIRLRLLLKLQRDYLLMFAEVMRFRAFSGLGYWRVQSETAALIRIMHDQPELSLEWMETNKVENGQRFFWKTHRKIKTLVTDWNMATEYDEASGISQHPRFMSVAPGALISLKDEPELGAIGITFTDIEHSTILFLWFWRCSVFHRKLITAFEEMFPDVSPQAFSQLNRSGFSTEVDLVKRALDPHLDALRRKGFETGFMGERRKDT